MAEPNWYVSNEGHVEGPFRASDLATNRLLVPSSYVWHDGLDEWQPVTQSELAGLVAGRDDPPWTSPGGAGNGGETSAAPGTAGAGWGEPRPGDPLTGPPGWSRPHPASSNGAGHAPSAGSPWSIAAMICGVIAVLFVPILIGPLGIIAAGVALARKEPRAALAMGIAVGGMILGFIFGVLTYVAL